MKIIEKAYRCEFCRKILQMEHAMKKHEDWCTYNPKNFSACSGCVFLQEKEIEIQYEANDGGGYREWFGKSKTFQCEKLNKELYPMKAVRKGLLKKYPESFEGKELMPSKCDHWNYTK